MLPERYKDDLLQLEKIACEQGNQLNLSLILITINPKANDFQQVLDYFSKKNIEIIYSDVEPDSPESYEPDDSIKPFDPSKIDIKMDKMSLDSIIKRIKNREFEFDADFQRKAGLWSNVQKSQLIESILLRIPLPAFYFDASDDDMWLIIDGLQRITTIKEFVVDQTLTLKGMEFLKELNGLTFGKLPRSLSRRIEETNVNAYLVNPSTPPNVKFNIFKRINTGGLILEPQEIRNALFQGEATKFINELAKTEIFLTATYGSIKSDRMLDREFCVRYVAFTCLPLETYGGVIDDFLNSAMIFLNKTTKEERDEIEKDFINVISVCYELFGKHTFRKMSSDDRRRPISKVLFEAWTYSIFKMDSTNIQKLIKNKITLQRQFIKLCEQDDFINANKASDKKSMLHRISKVENLITTVINGGELL